MHLPLNALKAFDAASRHLSFRRAAEELNVTPAAISQQIRALEELIGVPLFERTGRGLQLTSHGRAGLDKLREGLLSLSEAYRLMRDDKVSASLTLAVAPSLCARWLMPRLRDCTAVLPGLEMVIDADNRLIRDHESMSGELRDSGDSTGPRLAIRFGRGAYPGCRVQRLMPATVVPLCSPVLLRDAGSSPHPPDLFDRLPLLHDETPYEGRLGWDDWMRAAGYAGLSPRPGLHFNNVSLALDSAAAGQGVVLSLAELARDDLQAGRLVVPFGPSIPLQQAWYVACPERIADNPDVLKLTQWLMQQATAMPALAGLPPAPHIKGFPCHS